MAKNRNITTTQLALMTAAAVISLRGLPMMAQEELTMFFYIFFATFLVIAYLRSGDFATLSLICGAAVFGVFADEAPAQAAKAALLRVYPQCWVLRPEAKGARVVGRG